MGPVRTGIDPPSMKSCPIAGNAASCGDIKGPTIAHAAPLAKFSPPDVPVLVEFSASTRRHLGPVIGDATGEDG